MSDLHEVTKLFHNRILPPEWRVWADFSRPGEISLVVTAPDEVQAGSIVAPSAADSVGGVRFVDSKSRWRNDSAHVVMALQKVVEDAMLEYRKRQGFTD